MTPLFKKMNLAEIKTILLLNAPQSFDTELAQLEGVEVLRQVSDTKTSFVLGFAVTQAECDFVSSIAKDAAVGDALVWLAYPKGTSKRYTCEFNRDTGWAVLGAAGFEPVRQIAIDEDWSALRFRRTKYIKSLKRANARTISPEGQCRTQK